MKPFIPMRRAVFSQWYLAARASLVVLSFVVFFFGAAHAGPPAEIRKLPGVSKGDVDTRWIAPYVLAMTYSVGGARVTTVRWFDHKGSVTRELSGPEIDARPDYIDEWTRGKTVIHDVNGKWKLVVPNKPGPAGYITAAGDVFVHEFHPTESQIAADIYVVGKLVGTIGPFVQYKGRGVHLAKDGSLALLTWKSPKKEGVQVVVVGPNGKVKLCADCGEDVQDPYPIGGGKGVLVEVIGQATPPVRFRYLQAGGSWVSLDVGPNAQPIAWVPPGDMVLFLTSIGEKMRFSLIDCSTGKCSGTYPLRSTLMRNTLVRPTLRRRLL